MYHIRIYTSIMITKGNTSVQDLFAIKHCTANLTIPIRFSLTGTMGF